MSPNPDAGSRSGHTLPELAVALVLAGIVGAAVLGLLTSSTQAVRQLVARSDQAEVRRTVSALLHEELSVGVAGRDWSVDGERAVRLRAFRGYARVCRVEGSTLTVAWRGQRLPDPVRDSVLVLATDGRWHPVDLAWEGAPPDPARCGSLAEEGVMRERVGGLRLSGNLPEAPLLLRYFEQGRYSLEDGAFRYRQGTGGRQPLTPELVAAASRLSAVSAGLKGGGGAERGPGGPAGLGALEVELHLLVPRGTGVGARVLRPDPDRWMVRGDPAGPQGRLWP